MKRTVLLLTLLVMLPTIINAINRNYITPGDPYNIWDNFVTENCRILRKPLFSDMKVNLLLFSFKVSGDAIVPVSNFFLNHTAGSSSIRLFRQNRNYVKSNMYGLEVSFFSLEYTNNSIIQISQLSFKPVVTMFEFFFSINNLPRATINFSMGFGYIIGVHFDWEVFKEFFETTFYTGNNDEEYNRYYAPPQFASTDDLLTRVGLTIQNVPIFTLNMMIKL